MTALMAALLAATVPAPRESGAAPLGKGFLRSALAADGPSRAVIPPQTIPLTFNHKIHLEQGMDCLQCHEHVDKSARSADVNTPTEESCETCHDDVTQVALKKGKLAKANACQMCHPSFDQTVRQIPARVELPPPNLKFPHDKHLARGIKCAACHAEMEQVIFATRAQLPRMTVCLGCHDGAQAPAGCKTCHLQEADGKLSTVFPSGQLAPSGVLRGDDHGRDFLRRHKEIARRDEAYCMNCHRESECLSCHAQSVQKPFAVHPANFVSTHQQAARANIPDCTSCHRAQSFCIGCHTRLGATLSSAFAPRDAVGDLKFENPGRASFHPPRATFIDQRGPDHHSVQAQRNMNACAACHLEADCIVCHRTRELGESSVGFNPNPHPAGFKAACGTMLAKSRSACLKCHQPSDVRLSACN